MVVCFSCVRQTYNKILNYQTIGVDKVESIRSGVDGFLFFFPSPYKGAEEKKIKTTPGARKKNC
jgi:hypothetical protein